MLKNDFLLNTKTSKKLYGFVKDLPIIDYHNHLSLSDINENKRFTDIYDMWISPDPYKHRAMRMCGVSEYYITGDALKEEKFIKWCETLTQLIGNPLYHWSLMELQTIFKINKIPNKENAVWIYTQCNKYLADNEVTALGLLDKFNVECACPCASVIDDISIFENSDGLSPSLRGDDIVNPTIDFIKKLSQITAIDIINLKTYKEAVVKRLDYFQKCGCVFSDHALDNGFVFSSDGEDANKLFNQLLNEDVNQQTKEKLMSHLLLFLGKEYSKRHFVMQLHIGAQRYTSTKLRNKVGPAGGFAAIGNSVNVKSLTYFLDTLDSCEFGLPKTVLFTLNPSDDALISVLSGSYSKDGECALITQGPAWWWCDHKLGMENMLENTSAFSVLSNFIGMTTDSRSFLSFVRHDYFRRILCNWVGKKVETGEFVCSNTTLQSIVKKICYTNAKITLEK